MNQSQLNRLFDLLDAALVPLNRKLGGFKLKANDCQLNRIQPDGVCEFMHKPTGIRLRYDAKANKLIVK